jgi:outer membrane lipoprotein SlyB
VTNQKEVKKMKRSQIRNTLTAMLLTGTIFIAGCAGGPLTAREKGAGIGALGGAAAGGIIGSAVGHPGVGAAVGGGLGLGAGALIGDQMQGQDNRNSVQDEDIRRNQAEIDRQRRELDRLRRERGEY